MGDIVMFKPTERRAGLLAARTPHDAEILFFTGVRYERHEPPAAEPPPAKAGKPARLRSRARKHPA